VTELVDAVGMHQPGVSRHLKGPRDAGLVDVRRAAQRRLYRLRLERTSRAILPKERSQ
jgi:DNA-binding transcriptional ArsR family regulator